MAGDLLYVQPLGTSKRLALAVNGPLNKPPHGGTRVAEIDYNERGDHGWLIQLSGGRYAIQQVGGGLRNVDRRLAAASLRSMELRDLAPSEPLSATDLKSIRHSLGLSAEAFARLVRVESGRTVRRWEAGERDIPGPVAVIAEGLRDSSVIRKYFGVSLAETEA